MSMKALVKIDLKEGITDPEGLNALKALKLLGFENVSEVRTAKIFKITLDSENKEEAEAQIRQMCERLLINPVVQSFSIDFQ